MRSEKSLIPMKFLICIFVGFISLGALKAGDVKVNIVDTSSEPIKNAVVSLTPLFEAPIAVSETQKAVMKQQNTMFHPFVLPIKTGTSVSFPNFDEFRHHVYSFSKAKQFELRLYGKDESNELIFNEAGIIALGCNIHDNMLAYIYVTDDPLYTVSDVQGSAVFKGLPVGRYAMSLWHPDQKSKQDSSHQEIEIGNSNAVVGAVLKMRSVKRLQKGPDGQEYNE